MAAKAPEEARLRRLAEKWQRILRLEDWDIDVRYGDRYEANDGEASVDTHSELKLALVKLLKPEARPASGDWQEAFPARWDDDEHSIVHELLHVRFDGLIEHSENGSTHHALEEQAIDALAVALIRLDRKDVGQADG